MPTYEYLCRKCGHTFEEFQSMSEDALTRCPKCDTDNLARIMGTSGAVIFKGSGFYVTDYRKQQVSGAANSGKKDGEKNETAEKQTEKEGPAKSAAEKKETGKNDSGKGTPGSQPSSPPPPSGPPEKKG
jgi:putative FmdB family regulatory protein